MKDIGFWHRGDGEEIKICGRFALGAGPVMGAFVGQGFTPTRTGVGDYLLTFTGAAAQLKSVKAIAKINAVNVDMHVHTGVFTPGAAGAATLQLLTMTGAVVTELPVGANDQVHFEVTLYGECLAT